MTDPASSVPRWLEPPWFLLVFVGVWLGISAFLSIIGGWRVLSRRYPATDSADGEAFRFATGSMGLHYMPANYGSILFITVNERGFRMSVLFLFRFMSPPFFIPWSDVESAEEEKRFFYRYAVIRVRDQWPVIMIRGRAGAALLDAFRRQRGLPSPVQ